MDRHFSQAVFKISQQSGRARKQGRRVEAAMLGRIAVLMSTPEKTVEKWTYNLELVNKLLSWLPLVDKIGSMSPKQRKAWLTVGIMNQRFESVTQEELIRRVTEQPGAPQTTRRVAVRALELHLEGKRWKEVAQDLPCDWTMVENPGNSLRREVQFLKRTLKECGVDLEDL